ncbi:hypothetical protein IDM40_12815 [Nocardiopsis sp. HNM0947]|uniref:TPM domain-containing protein n=1 Tax=Nocardiopsis coralli TaxID=2772213 RepID=A0ABR9P6Y0_9ACTN|nr:hypothetical protein [Nocardiopsis coralli]
MTRAAAPALLLAALLSGPAAPASADDAPEEGTGTGASPAQSIAEHLESSPVHVDPAYDDAFPEDVRARVAEQIEESGLDLYVVVVPLTQGDAWGGETESLATAVHDRLGGGERHYLVHNSTGGLDGTDLGGTPGESDRPALHGAMAASYTHMGGEERTIPDQVETAVEAALSPDPEAAYEEAMEAHQAENGSPSTPVGTLLWTPWVLGGAVLLALLALALSLYLVVRARTHRASTPVAQHAAFDNADRARLESLVERAENDLIELGERLHGETSAPPRQVSRALDARDAAARVFDRMAAEGPNLPDAAGVLVLLDRAEDALAGLRTPRRPCYANPLHGTGTAPTQWREFGGTRTIKVPLCSECARAVGRRLRPTVLPAEHEGSQVPYYEVPAEESVWSATGYGSLRDDLVERILRGEPTARR